MMDIDLSNLMQSSNNNVVFLYCHSDGIIDDNDEIYAIRGNVYPFYIEDNFFINHGGHCHYYENLDGLNENFRIADENEIVLFWKQIQIWQRHSQRYLEMSN